MQEQLRQQGRNATETGRAERNAGDIDAAIKHYRHAAGLYREIGDDLNLAHTIRHVGDMLREQRSLKESRACYEEAATLYRKHPEANRLDVANALRGYALLLDAATESEKAKALWQEAREYYAAAGVEVGVKEAERRLQE
jgi:tetratricopeptide (TPR) repeat protein